jgi:choline dehydrogenase-like flavoprotein
MLRDAADFTDGHAFHADICIVGCGAAGITIALDLIGSGLRVLILESGGFEPEDETQSLYRGAVVDEALHSPPDRYRQRRFGGTTTIWGGRCMPLDDIDFEQRSYVPDSGWPIRGEELLPFYTEANRLCEAGRFAYRADVAFGTAARQIIDGFQSQHFSSDRLERFSCPTDFGARYGHKLRSAQNLEIVLHANLTTIKLDPAGVRVDHLVVRDLAGRQFTAHAGRFVLATGGLETPRLLLANRDQRPAGLGNENDIVGRYYMCHLAGTIGSIRIDRPASAVFHGYQMSDEGIYCRRRFALSENTQRREQIGNFIARLHHPRITDPAHRNAMLSLLFLAKPLIPYEYAKRLHGDESASASRWLQHVGNVLTGPLDAAGFAWHMIRDRILAERKFPSIIIKSKANLFSLDFHAEQFPNRSSRVTLSGNADRFGMPQILVDWRYLPGDVHTVARSLELLASDFETGGFGRLEYDPASVEHEMTRYGAYGGHHIGTARMGADPRTSVVDANCRLHSVDNLYISSAAVFPTSSQANPTLTVVALALRLARYLRGPGAPR